MSECSVHGSLPQSIGLLANLRSFNINNMAGITGSIPASIGNLSSLLNLEISTTAVTGVIPSTLGNLKLLTSLQLPQNRLQYGISSSLGLLSSLKVLALNKNYLTSIIPTSLGLLSLVTTLDLHGNRLSSSLPSQLGLLSQLSRLNLKDNLLTSSIPITIGYLSALASLDLHNNRLTSSIPPTVGSMVSLTELHLENNNLTGTIPTSLGLLVSMTTIDAHSNKLTGSIPMELGKIKNLQYLDLSANHLVGGIPTGLVFLTNLETLDLHHNRLLGPIPREIESLSSLRSLNLNSNALTGAVPSTLARLTQLTYLSLSSNLLTGTVLEAVNNCTLLQALILDHNKFEGQIPPNFNLNSLTVLDIASNKFTGEILSIQNSQLGEFFAQNNSFFCYEEPSFEYTLIKSTDTVCGVAASKWTQRFYTQLIFFFVCNAAVLCHVLAGFRNSSALSRSWMGCGNPNSISSYTICQSWRGVRCYSNGITLSLSGLGLQGTIANTIGYLPSLLVLDLSSNSLTGRIPSQLSTLTVLNLLSLANNHLNGFIPSGLSSLSALDSLNLSANSLVGSIPVELAVLSNLTALDLHGNSLVSAIPSSIENLVKLEILDLSGNALTGLFDHWPGGGVSVERLQYVSVSGNSLRGSLPLFLGNYSNLLFLDLSDNSFSSSIPSTVIGLTKVVHFDVSANHLTSSIPPSIGSLMKLTVLYLSYNSLQSAIPSEMGYLTSLVSLRLNSNGLTSTVPSTFTQLKNLEQLYLFSNKLQSSIPSSLGSLKNLTILQLGLNKFTSEIPSALGDLSAVRELGLAGNQLVGSIPSAFFNLAQLSNLLLHSNSLTGAIPLSVARLQQLTTLSVHDNSLGSSLPDSIGSLSNLVNLEIHNNYFTNSIPTSVGELTALKLLYAHSNRLSSAIPSALGLLTKIQFLDLSANALQHSVPSSLTKLVNTQQFLLDNNRLTGIFPVEICNIVPLNYMTLAGNSLLCSPWCQSDANWTSGNIFPRCQDDNDRALKDLQDSLGVTRALSSQIISSSRTLRKVYPPGSTSTDRYMSDNAFAYVVQIQTNGALCPADVTLCLDRQCAKVIGHVKGSEWTVPNFQGFAPRILRIDSSQFYYNVSAFTQLPTGELCIGRYGFIMTVITRASPAVSWTFESPPYPSSSLVLEAAVEVEGLVASASQLYAYGLCQRPWSGITCNLGQVTGLSLGALGLAGTLPSSLGLLTGLTSLDLSGNFISGPIVSSVGYLTRLDTLLLFNNELNGCIPQNLSLASSLYQVDLSGNSLSGSVPSYFGGMALLRSLTLDSNQFQHEVPSELCEAILYDNLMATLTRNPLLTCYQEYSCDQLFALYPRERGVIFDSSLNMCVPTSSPTTTPTSRPSGQPTGRPSSQPIGQPTALPSGQPTDQPSGKPSAHPSSHSPTVAPTPAPTTKPTVNPSSRPTPTHTPSVPPSEVPTGRPSAPSTSPTSAPSKKPTPKPSTIPSTVPTSTPSSASPTRVPTAAPTSKPTNAVVVYTPALSEANTIVVAVICSFVAFVVLFYFLYSWCLSKRAQDRRQRWKVLRALPVHKMLLYDHWDFLKPMKKVFPPLRSSFQPHTPEELLKAIANHGHTVCDKDYEGQTALGIIMKKSHMISINDEVVYQILLRCLFNLDTQEMLPPSEKFYDWTYGVQQDTDTFVLAVDRILNYNRAYSRDLAEGRDATGRKAVDIAGPRCKILILRRLYLHGRYEIRPGPVVHISVTSMVVMARDHGDPSDPLVGGASLTMRERAVVTDVALKFMRHREQFRKEVDIRAAADLDHKYILPINTSYEDGFRVDENDEFLEEDRMLVVDGDRFIYKTTEDRDFRDDAIFKGYGDFPFCVVMEAAVMSLHDIIHHEQGSGLDTARVRGWVKDLALCLAHVHSKGIVHGDLKPLNVLLVGRFLKLTDFDASASFESMEVIGEKFSSAYVPPEMLFKTDTGLVRVRTHGDPGGLILANPAQDMWALGCLLYYIATGCTLFHSNVEDNLVEGRDFEELLNWTSECMYKKLTVVQDKFARNLLSLLLVKDASKRLSADRVLTHPFITGNNGVRMMGDKPQWDVFLSYRVSSDAKHAELVYDQLTKVKKLKVWWDQKCLLPGQNWEEGFCRGLMTSANFVCLLSRGAIKHPSLHWQNFECLAEDSRPDNVLLEWRLALELKERDMILGIFPIMIGDLDVSSGLYSNYFGSGCNPTCQEIVVHSVEDKVREHLDREGLGSPYRQRDTVKGIINKILLNQGGFIEKDPVEALRAVSTTIENMTKQARLDGRPSLHGSGSSFGSNMRAISQNKSTKSLIRSSSSKSAVSAAEAVHDQLAELVSQVNEKENSLVERDRRIQYLESEQERLNKELQLLAESFVAKELLDQNEQQKLQIADLYALVESLQRARNLHESDSGDVALEPVG